MSRYSLNLRQKYAPDEPTTGGGIAKGIGTALEEYEKYHEAERTEQNTMAAAGATRAPDGPNDSVMGRIRGIGSAIGGLLGRDGSAPAAPATPPLQPTGTFAPQQPRGALPQGVGPGIVPPQQPAVNPALADAANVARGVAGANAGPVPVATPATPATDAVHAARPSISAALSQEIAPYTYTGVHGAKYQVDPLHGARVQAAAGQMQLDVRQQEQIQSLVDAGMSPTEARARVLNNVVKYDDTFGQQAGRGGARISNEEWDRRQNKMQADRKDLETLRQAGKITDREYSRRRLELQEQAAEDRRLHGDVQSELGIAGAIDRTINKDPIARSTETDSDRAAREKSERERGSHISAAVDANTRQKNAHASQDQAAVYARRLKTQGLSNDQIRARMKAEGYNIQ